MLLNREQILGHNDLPTETVEVPEWGGSVIVKALNGAQRDSYEQSLITGSGKNQKMNLINARARLVALSVVDSEGNPLFTSKDVVALSNKSAAALDRIFAAAQKLSGLTKEDMDEMVGNSEEA